MRHFGLKSLCASEFDLQVPLRLPAADPGVLVPVVFGLEVSSFPSFPKMSGAFCSINAGGFFVFLFCCWSVFSVLYIFSGLWLSCLLQCLPRVRCKSKILRGHRF